MCIHACTDPSCVFCRQSANGNLNVEGIAMYTGEHYSYYNECSVIIYSFPPKYLVKFSFTHGATRGGPKISPSSQLLSTIQIIQSDS